MLKHTIIKHKPKIVVVDNTQSYRYNPHQYKKADKWNQTQYNNLLNDFKINEGDFLVYDTITSIRDLFQVYYLHKIELDVDKIEETIYDGKPCGLCTIKVWDVIQTSAVEWQVPQHRRKLTDEEKSVWIDDKVLNRIQKYIQQYEDSRRPQNTGGSIIDPTQVVGSPC